MNAKVPRAVPGRPLFVKFDGGKIYVSAHDRFYLDKLRKFKRLIAASHPDRQHRIWAAGRTRKLLRRRKRFQEQESKWYATFGLSPPKGGGRCESSGSEWRELRLGSG